MQSNMMPSNSISISNAPSRSRFRRWASFAKGFAINPGATLFDKDLGRRIYKSICSAAMTPRLKPLQRRLRELPPADPDLTLDRKTGYRVVPTLNLPTVPPLLDRCREMLINGTSGRQRPEKAQLVELLEVNDIPSHPQFLDFALDPMLLRSASDYIGSFPILTKVAFWHSHPTSSALGNSQLYHCDHEDTYQFKVFLHVSDVDIESGPLTVLDAETSRTLRRRLGYTCYHKLPDDRIRPLIPSGAERVLTAPRGAAVLVDTSQVLHFGSRVSTKDRFVVVLQYLSISNFMMSPFARFRRLPYAHLVRQDHGLLQRSVLTGKQ